MSAPTPQPDVPVPTSIPGAAAPVAPAAPVAGPTGITVTTPTVPNPAPVTTLTTGNTATTAPVAPTPTNNTATTAAETALQSSLAAFSASLKNIQTPATPTDTTTTDTSGTTGTKTGGTLQDTLSQLLGLQGQLAGKAAATQNIDSEVGLDAKTTAAQTAANNYNAREQYYNDAIDKMQTTNTTGMSQDAINENVQNLTRQKNSELADLAIIKSAADGDLTTAQTIATQKVNAEFQPIQDQIDNLKTIYSLQENDMTDSEKQQAQAAITEKQSQLDEQKTMRLDAYAEQIKQNDPLYKAQTAHEQALADGKGAATVVGDYAAKFVPGAKLPDGTPTLDQNNYINPAAFKAAIADAGENKISRATFIQQYGSQLYNDPTTGYAAYGLTPAEQKLITGALPTPAGG